jgi:integrase
MGIVGRNRQNHFQRHIIFSGAAFCSSSRFPYFRFNRTRKIRKWREKYIPHKNLQSVLDAPPGPLLLGSTMDVRAAINGSSFQLESLADDGSVQKKTWQSSRYDPGLLTMEGRNSISMTNDGQKIMGKDVRMTVQIELQNYLDTTKESIRGLSLRAGLSAKTVSDIMNIAGLRPRYKTLVALTNATGIDLVSPSFTNSPQTFDALVKTLKEDDKPILASRITWLLKKADWYGNRVVCRNDVLEFFAGHNAASLNLTKGSLSTYKCDVLAAIDGLGQRNRSRGVIDLRGVMSDIYKATKNSDIPTDCRLKAGPFFLFLDDKNILPQQVTTEVVAEYHAYRLQTAVLDESKCRKHTQNIVTLIRHLSENGDTRRFGFSAIESPFHDGRDKYEMDTGVFAQLLSEFDRQVAPWACGKASRDGMCYNDFLAALDGAESQPASSKKEILRAKVEQKRQLSRQEQVEQSEDKLRRYGFLTPDNRWSERTLRTRRGYVISVAKALASSCDIILESIDELTDPEFLTAAAEALADANQGSESGYIESVLKTVKKISIGFCNRQTEDVQQIKVLIKHYSTGKRGIAPRNKAKLRKFTDERIQSTINLSGTVMNAINAEITRKRKAHQKKEDILPQPIDVVDVEMARDIAAMVAHDILIRRAPRSANVIGIKLECIAFRDGLARITIPAVEVKMRGKGDPDYVVDLGLQQSKLMRQYIEKVRTKLLLNGDDANPYLFPQQSRKGFEVNRPYNGLLLRVTRRLYEHVGVSVHPHLYRHLIGWIWLRDSMDNLPRVQKLLGHKSLRTTVEYYAELEENLVGDEWQSYLEGKSLSAG